MKLTAVLITPVNTKDCHRFLRKGRGPPREGFRTEFPKESCKRLPSIGQQGPIVATPGTITNWFVSECVSKCPSFQLSGGWLLHPSGVDVHRPTWIHPPMLFAPMVADTVGLSVPSPPLCAALKGPGRMET